MVWCGLALAADDASDSQSAPTSSPSPEGIEIPAERTATSETFNLPDGSREARIYQTPVNYRDQEGIWQPIQEGLEPEGNAFVNGDNSFDLRLPRRMGAAPLRFSLGDQWIAERLLGAPSKAGEIEGKAASYEAASCRAPRPPEREP